VVHCSMWKFDSEAEFWFVYLLYMMFYWMRCQVMPNLYAIHMDPTVWKDPTSFRPERFLDATGRVIDKDKVIPFSIGS